MKTLQDVLDNFKFDTFIGRDTDRIVEFCNEEQMAKLGYGVKDGAVHIPEEFTEEAVKELLKRDLDFAFEKALDKRGISASCMYGVIKMWNYILDADIPSGDEYYAQYGLPYLKATALYHGLPNPIGDDQGDEFKYSQDGGY